MYLAGHLPSNCLSSQVLAGRKDVVAGWSAACFHGGGRLHGKMQQSQQHPPSTVYLVFPNNLDATFETFFTSR